MNKTRNYFVFIIICSIFVLLVYFLKIGGEQYYNLIVRLINYTIGLTTIFFGYLNIKHFGLKSLQGKSVMFITLSLLFWLLGDIVWDLSGNAVVSIADLFYYIYYILIIIGIIYAILTVYPNFFKEKRRLTILTIISSALVLIYLRFFPLSWDQNISTIKNLATYGYTIADLFILIIIVFFVSATIFGVYSQTWIFFGIGVLSFLMGDIFYTINYETYKSGDLIDLFWLFSYLFYAIGFVLLKHNTEKTFNKIKTYEKRRIN